MDPRRLLEELGYAAYDTNVILFLFRNKSPATAKEISEKAEVPLSRIYSILIELKKQNLVKKVPGKTTTYVIADKNVFLQQVGKKKTLELKEQEKKVESALQLLEKQVDIRSPKTAVRHFTKNQVLEEISRLKKGELIVVSSISEKGYKGIKSAVIKGKIEDII